MSRPSQTESVYVQTLPDGKCLCPDPPRRKVPMSRLSCVRNFSCVHCAFKSPHVQTFVRSKEKFVRSKIDNLCVHVQTRAFKRPYVQTFVRSKLPISRLSCVPYQKPSAANLIICAFLSSLSCFQKTLCRDFSAFKMAYVQTFECSKPKFAHQNLQLS